MYINLVKILSIKLIQLICRTLSTLTLTAKSEYKWQNYEGWYHRQTTAIKDRRLYCRLCRFSKWELWLNWHFAIHLLILNAFTLLMRGPSWPWSYGSWIYNYLCVISAYHHWCCELESRSRRGVQHYLIKPNHWWCNLLWLCSSLVPPMFYEYIVMSPRK